MPCHAIYLLYVLPGTASILACDAPSIFTFSMHGRHNYPFIKEHSSADVNLDDGCTDDMYMILLKQHLPNIITQTKPQLVIYQVNIHIHQKQPQTHEQH